VVGMGKGINPVGLVRNRAGLHVSHNSIDESIQMAAATSGFGIVRRVPSAALSRSSR